MPPTKIFTPTRSGSSGRYLRDIAFPHDKATHSDYTHIKEILVSTGAAVSTTLYWLNDSSRYKAANYAYYYSGSETPNAAVAIVGWNDSYSRNNFGTLPSAAGAFLVRALTSTSPSSTFGSQSFDDGYFWVSYYDANIGKNNAAFSGVVSSAYGEGGVGAASSPHGWVGNYATVSGGQCHDATTCWASNHFTNSTGQNIRLTAVSFYTTQPDSTGNGTGYTVIVTTNPPAAKNPLGTAASPVGQMANQTGSTTWPGFHTVIISTGPERVLIAPGGSFSLTVGLTNSASTSVLPFSYALAGYSASFSASANKSFIFASGTNTDWCDTTTAGGCRSGGTTAGYVPISYSYILNPDITPPAPAGKVINGLTAVDRTATNYNTQLSFNWPAFTEPESGIAYYEYAISTQTNGTEFKNWTRLSSDTTYYTLTNVELEYNKRYYVRVRATNGEGIVSVATGTASGILVSEAPAQPTGLSGTSPSNSSVQWTWSRAARNNGYKVYSSSSNTVLASTALNTETWTHTGISTPNAPSSIYIRGIGSAGDNDSVPSVSSAVYTRANVPGAPSGSGTSRYTMTATWTANSNSADTQYQVLYSTMNTFAPSSSTLYVTSLTTQLSSLTENTTYYLRVRARNGSSALTAYSATGSGATWPSIPGPITVATASVTGATSIMWLWEDVADETSYQVLSYPANQVLKELPGNSTSWEETGLSPNASYTRYIKAINISGSSTSGYLTAITSAAAPGSMALETAARSAVNATWTANGNPSGSSYRLELSTTSGFQTDCTLVSTTTALSLEVTGLTPGKTYYMRGFGLNSQGTLSAASASASAALSGPPNITSITPATAHNLNTSAAIAISGSNFLSGDGGVLTLAGQSDRTADTTVISGAGAATASFNTLGLAPGVWTLLLRDTQGIESVTTAALTITENTGSGSQNQTKTDSGSSRATVNTVGAHAQAAIPAGIAQLTDALVYTSSAPAVTPLLASPQQMTAATRALSAGTSLLSSSPMEIVAYAGGSQVTAAFGTAVPLYITYPDADSDGVVDGTAFSEASLYMVVLDTQTSTWKPVSGSAVVKAARHVLSPVYHFSVYALVGSAPSTDLSEAKVYPSPWKPSSGGSHDRATLRIAGLPTQCEAYIYNVAGELVIHLPLTNSTFYDWDGKNGSGETVASGVYFLRLKASGQSKILKFAIQR